MRRVVSAFLFLPFAAGLTTEAVSEADTMLSGGGESDESEDAIDIFFAMFRVVNGWFVVVMEVDEVIGEPEVVRSEV